MQIPRSFFHRNCCRLLRGSRVFSLVVLTAAFSPNNPTETACLMFIGSTENSFGALLFKLRERAFLSQRKLSVVVGLPASVISEIENGRRPPPPERYVHSIGRALKASASEQTALSDLAALERQSLGLRIGKATPTHVAALLRDIASISHQLSPEQATTIRAQLLEGGLAMK